MAYSPRSVSLSEGISEKGKRSRGKASRQKTSDTNSNCGSHPNLPIPGRPKTPVVCMYASEAHIHRIRSASSQADYKSQSRLASAAGRVPPTSNFDHVRYFPTTIEEDDEGDFDDVESVDWTAPFDIKSFLYKDEYNIAPKRRIPEPEPEYAQSEASGKETINSGTASLPCDEPDAECPDTNDKTVVEDVIICDEVGGGDHPGPVVSMKMEILENYVCKSARLRKCKAKPSGHYNDRKISDYTVFAKQLNQELKELEIESRRLDSYSPRKKLKEKSKEELIDQGYKTLKSLYELNPELTESAAGKHINGPPGQHWMGLTRVEVLEIMQKIRKELGIPYPENYKEDQERLKALRQKMSCSPSLSNKNSKANLKKSTNSTKKSRSSRSTPREKGVRIPPLRISQLPIEHVPGPKHLHTNICIRPWEPALDGWGLDDYYDDFDDETKDSEIEATLDSDKGISYGSIVKSEVNSRSGSSKKYSKSTAAPPTSPLKEKPEDKENSHETREQEDEIDVDEFEEEPITLEIFNAVSRSSR